MAIDSRLFQSAARLVSLPLVVLAAGLSTRYGGLKQLDPLGPDGEAIMDYNCLLYTSDAADEEEV